MLATTKISTGLEAVSNQFEIVKSHSLYCLSIGVRVGVSSAQIAFSDLGFSDEEISAKQKALIKTPSIAVYPKLRTAGNKLNSAKKQLQGKFMINGNHRWWFVLEDRIDDLVADIESFLLPLCEELRQETILSYPEDKADFQSRLTTGIAEFLPAQNRDIIIQKYLDNFPTISDVEENFTIDIDGPIKINSILEDAAVAEKVSILSLHKQWKETITKSLETSLKEVMDEIYGIVADLLSDIEKKPSAELSIKGKAKIETALNRLTLLIDFNKSLEGIVADANQNLVLKINQQVTSVASEYLSSQASTDNITNFLQQAKLRQRISDIRQSFAASVDFAGKGEGHRKIAQWMKI
jgi:hypothetical protein